MWQIEFAGHVLFGDDTGPIRIEGEDGLQAVASAVVPTTVEVPGVPGVVVLPGEFTISPIEFEAHLVNVGRWADVVTFLNDVHSARDLALVARAYGVEERLRVRVSSWSSIRPGARSFTLGLVADRGGWCRQVEFKPNGGVVTVLNSGDVAVYPTFLNVSGSVNFGDGTLVFPPDAEKVEGSLVYDGQGRILAPVSPFPPAIKPGVSVTYTGVSGGTRVLVDNLFVSPPWVRVCDD